MWDTAPKDASQVNDTAYTKDGLHAHTDTCYLMDSCGLQLFNCVAQSGAPTDDSSDEAPALNAEGEIEGATKLVDGFKVRIARHRLRWLLVVGCWVEAPGGLEWLRRSDECFRAWCLLLAFRQRIYLLFCVVCPFLAYIAPPMRCH